MEPSQAAYNVPAVLSLSGELNIAALELAFTSLVERHEILRTRFLTGDDESPCQQIDEQFRFTLHRLDLRG